VSAGAGTGRGCRLRTSRTRALRQRARREHLTGRFACSFTVVGTVVMGSHRLVSAPLSPPSNEAGWASRGLRGTSRRVRPAARCLLPCEAGQPARVTSAWNETSRERSGTGSCAHVFGPERCPRARGHDDDLESPGPGLTTLFRAAQSWRSRRFVRVGHSGLPALPARWRSSSCIARGRRSALAWRLRLDDRTDPIMFESSPAGSCSQPPRGSRG
jgi:hypothetical protein